MGHPWSVAALVTCDLFFSCIPTWMCKWTRGRRVVDLMKGLFKISIMDPIHHYCCRRMCIWYEVGYAGVPLCAYCCYI
ncbi:hypothetical protein F5Y02DRAFT_404999 [Annulohypoxylon stygium]|nr:hypothetical protein F5Y02DRAFT_404999 [Annulohypoxylon stygium]